MVKEAIKIVQECIRRVREVKIIKRGGQGRAQDAFYPVGNGNFICEI
jgi:hypothetical protein